MDWLQFRVNYSILSILRKQSLFSWIAMAGSSWWSATFFWNSTSPNSGSVDFSLLEFETNYLQFFCSGTSHWSRYRRRQHFFFYLGWHSLDLTSNSQQVFTAMSLGLTTITCIVLEITSFFQMSLWANRYTGLVKSFRQFGVCIVWLKFQLVQGLEIKSQPRFLSYLKG